MQKKFRAVIMRGGTSRAVVFRDEDLPSDQELRDRVILAAFGSPDPYGRQIDGLGGATSTTSKVAVIGRSASQGANVDYTFGQVAIDRSIVDRSGNCGNISSAVGPFAIDEGFVAGDEAVTNVHIFNTNTRKLIVAHVPCRNGRFDPEGDFAIPGIPLTGSKIVLDYIDPGGAVTGRLLPTGNPMDVLEVGGIGAIPVSIVDAANPVVFVRFHDLGIPPGVSPEAVDSDPQLLARIESVRAAAAVAAGLAGSPAEATRERLSVPKIAFIAAPAGYRQIDGSERNASTIDLLAKSMSMGKMHRAFQLTGAICAAIAAAIPGTLVRDLASTASQQSGTVRIGHPSGVMELSASVQFVDGAWRANMVSTTRTARRLMEGFIFVPEAALRPAITSVV